MKKLTAGVVITALVGFLYYLWIRFTGFGIPCPFNYATGLYCPGCGVTRMCTEILRFDFKAAFGFNPVLFVSIPVLLVVFATTAWRYIRSGFVRLLMWQDLCLWIVSAALLVQCVWRNVQLLIG